MARGPKKAGVSERQFAKKWGKSHTAVQKGIASGRIPVEPDGSIIPEKALEALDANTDPAQQRNGKADNTFLRARTATEVLKARERRLRVGRLERSLIPAAILEEVVGAAFTRVRSLLLALPRRAGRTLAKMTDPAEVTEALEKLIHDALEELSDIEVVAKIKRDSGDSD